MGRLIYPNEGPPGGFRYTEYRSGATIEETNLWALVDKVIEHRKHRGWGPTDKLTVRAEVERQLCIKLDASKCKSEGPDDDWKPVDNLVHSFGLTQIMSASRAALEWLRSGMGMSSIEESDSRRKICTTCPLNLHAHGCKCDILYKTINAIVPADRQYPELNICGACGCSLKAKVASPSNVIVASENGKPNNYPSHCWVPALIKKTTSSC